MCVQEQKMLDLKLAPLDLGYMDIIKLSEYWYAISFTSSNVYNN